jgi:hypothetical protein
MAQLRFRDAQFSQRRIDSLRFSCLVATILPPVSVELPY